MSITTFEQVITRTALVQSEVFGREYEEILNNSESQSLTNIMGDDINGLLKKINLEYSTLTHFQKEALNKIFNELNNIQINIDPNRLKSFEYYFNDDEELLLYRESEKAIINIIINPEDTIAFSFIPFKNGQDKLEFIDLEGDFECLVYNFLA